VAHQWWYNLVGNDQVDEPWLDEALTQYTTVLYFEDRYGEEVAEKASQAGLWDRWQQAQDAGRDRPVAGPVASFAREDYGPIVYGKGPLFFSKLREEVGDGAFDRILQVYLQEHRYRIATPESFLAVAERVSGRSLASLYQRWILE
jgi:aminopeptidase N